MILEVRLISIPFSGGWLIKWTSFLLPSHPSRGRNIVTMTIRNEKAFLEGIWDWGCLDDCFPGKMKITDIDGFFERKGKFLVLETKQPGVTVPLGQEIMFKNMQRTGLFTVIVVWGEKNNPVEIQVYYSDGSISKKKPADIYKFKEIVSWWYCQVEKESMNKVVG